MIFHSVKQYEKAGLYLCLPGPYLPSPTLAQGGQKNRIHFNSTMAAHKLLIISYKHTTF